MNVLEAVEYMKQGRRVTANVRPRTWYKYYQNGSVVGLWQDTTCSAQIFHIWHTTDEFITDWAKTNHPQDRFEFYV